ncbi:MAG: hypothetical protein ACLFPQ_03945 [Candidatus Woesearchaeota archaeon]
MYDFFTRYNLNERKISDPLYWSPSLNYIGSHEVTGFDMAEESGLGAIIETELRSEKNESTEKND